MSAASALWSRQQREWLQALGHPPLMLVGPRDAVGTEPPLAEPQPAAEPVKKPATAPGVAPVAREAPPPLPTRDPENGLQRALLRATGVPAAEAGKLLQSLGVDWAALRGDPAAKRLLWSRLRRLRGGRSP